MMSSWDNLGCALPFHHLRPTGFFHHAPIARFKKWPRFQGPFLCLLMTHVASDGGL